MYRFFLKRVIDIIVSFCGLIVLSPIILVITLYLTYFNNGKPFFHQFRPGKNEEIFKILKFRTMNDKKNAEGELLPDFQRITKMGMLLRKTSLDEIPQLFNVLTGKMSLIGPRPLLIDYLSEYNERQKKRHDVKPGITGLAQVNGRNSITWEQKFEYDVYYAENISFPLDIKILALTIKKVLVKEGVNSSENETMPYFKKNMNENHSG